MNKYECMYILKPNLEDEKRNELIKRFSDIIEKNGGKVLDVDEWGVKKMAYAINYITDGYYILTHFEANPDLPLELERNFKINEDVMRFLVLRQDN